MKSLPEERCYFNLNGVHINSNFPANLIPFHVDFGLNLSRGAMMSAGDNSQWGAHRNLDDGSKFNVSISDGQTYLKIDVPKHLVIPEPTEREEEWSLPSVLIPESEHRQGGVVHVLVNLSIASPSFDTAKYQYRHRYKETEPFATGQFGFDINTWEAVRLAGAGSDHPWITEDVDEFIGLFEKEKDVVNAECVNLNKIFAFMDEEEEDGEGTEGGEGTKEGDKYIASLSALRTHTAPQMFYNVAFVGRLGNSAERSQIENVIPIEHIVSARPVEDSDGPHTTPNNWSLQASAEELLAPLQELDVRLRKEVLPIITDPTKPGLVFEYTVVLNLHEEVRAPGEGGDGVASFLAGLKDQGLVIRKYVVNHWFTCWLRSFGEEYPTEYTWELSQPALLGTHIRRKVGYRQGEIPNAWASPWSERWINWINRAISAFLYEDDGAYNIPANEMQFDWMNGKTDTRAWISTATSSCYVNTEGTLSWKHYTYSGYVSSEIGYSFVKQKISGISLIQEVDRYEEMCTMVADLHIWSSNHALNEHSDVKANLFYGELNPSYHGPPLTWAAVGTSGLRMHGGEGRDFDFGEQTPKTNVTFYCDGTCSVCMEKLDDQFRSAVSEPADYPGMATQRHEQRDAEATQKFMSHTSW